MRVFNEVESFTTDPGGRDTVVAIGKFDGVHLGHQAIISRLVEVASERDLEPVIFTFQNNPLSFLHPETCPAPLMSPNQRLAALHESGIAACVMVEFDEEFSSISAEEYVSRVLVQDLHARHIIVGSDFRFGHRGAGDVALLRELGETLNFTVEVIDSVDDDELGRISSTAVREAILRGDVALASRMLGRKVTVRGEVAHGDARGRDLGFPTANVGGTVEGLVPADGVYAGRATVGGVRHVAAISVGTNPTFTPGGQSRVEAFLLDFSGDIYGQAIEIEFVEWLRGMVAYTGVDALIAQMHEDVRATRALILN